MFKLERDLLRGSPVMQLNFNKLYIVQPAWKGGPRARMTLASPKVALHNKVGEQALNCLVPEITPLSLGVSVFAKLPVR